MSEESAAVVDQATVITDKYLQRWHAIVGLVLSVVAIVGLWMTYSAATQSQIETIRERVSKTEYQNLISIEDSKALHSHNDRTDEILSQINQRLARIETKLDQRSR